MRHPILGLHHVTATVDDAQIDLNFCLDLLGLRLVKKTVNFDNHDVYHFYYGTERGEPGTIWTTFPYRGKGVRTGSKGAGQVVATSFSVPASSLALWQQRLKGAGVETRDVEARFGDPVLQFADPSGLVFELVGSRDDTRAPWLGSGIGSDAAIRGLHSVTMTVRALGPTRELLTGLLGYHVVDEDAARTRFAAGADAPGHAIDVVVDPDADPAVNGIGTVHHVAMAIATGDEQLRLREELVALGLRVTEVRDRCYFTSIYFREPGGVLFEVATITPGFTVDEDLASLGRGLKLPPWEEPYRPSIEASLPPVGPADMGPHDTQPVIEAGEPLGRAPVVIMVHGRNAAPANILDLLPRLARPGFTYLAPAAAGRTWYPHSFMAEIAANEPGLSSALEVLASLVARVEVAGVPKSRIVILGFSQGACLTAEFARRHPALYGGLVILTGGAIGPPGTAWNPMGSFDGTPVFLGSGNPDNHVPVSRVMETAALFSAMDAAVTTRIYPGRAHTVSDDEVSVARAILDEVSRVTVLSGTDSVRRLTVELDARRLGRLMVVTTPGRAREFREPDAALRLGGRVIGVSDAAALHVPIAHVRAALAEVDRLRPDALLAVGGGSAIGLAKAIVLERSLPIAAVPTTYAGSEMTSVWGVTDAGVKRTGRDPRVAPAIVAYDPALTVSLAPAVSAASGVNAIAHAVEALYAAGASPIAAAAAEQAIRLLAGALPRIMMKPDDLDARAAALSGARLAGIALEHASMGLHHKICHVLGGSFGLPHAGTHAAMLPVVVAFNAPAAPEAMTRVARALGASDAAGGLRSLNARLGLTASLGDLGFSSADVERAAALVVASSYPNPRPVTAGEVAELLRRAM